MKNSQELYTKGLAESTEEIRAAYNLLKTQDFASVKFKGTKPSPEAAIARVIMAQHYYNLPRNNKYTTRELLTLINDGDLGTVNLEDIPRLRGKKKLVEKHGFNSVYISVDGLVLQSLSPKTRGNDSTKDSQLVVHLLLRVDAEFDDGIQVSYNYWNHLALQTNPEDPNNYNNITIDKYSQPLFNKSSSLPHRNGKLKSTPTAAPLMASVIDLIEDCHKYKDTLIEKRVYQLFGRTDQKPTPDEHYAYDQILNTLWEAGLDNLNNNEQVIYDIIKAAPQFFTAGNLPELTVNKIEPVVEATIAPAPTETISHIDTMVEAATKMADGKLDSYFIKAKVLDLIRDMELEIQKRKS